MIIIKRSSAVLLAAATAATSLAACDGETADLRPARTNAAKKSGPASLDDASTSSAIEGGTGPAADAGSTEPSDAAPIEAGPPPINAFTDTAAYALFTPTTQSADHHGGDSNAGKDCLFCHTTQNTPPFMAAGTVFTTRGSNVGAAGVQVRIVTTTGEEIAFTGTDSSGNFWFEGTTPLPAGAKVGIRDATQTRLMNGTPSQGSCNSANCHIQPQPIFLSQ